MKDEKFMLEALKEALKASKKGDVPIGAVIVSNNKIIAKGHNKKEYKKNAVLHAEIVAIQKACKKKKSWYLNDCTLYVTLEPCMMCTGAIIQSRIKEVVFATESPKFGCVESIQKIENGKHNHVPFVKSGICREKSVEIMKQFFKNKRG